MAQITFNIPDGSQVRALNATVYLNGYRDTVPNPQNPGQTIPNPVSKLQFFKSVIINQIKENIRAYESVATITTATNQLVSEVEGISIT